MSNVPIVGDVISAGDQFLEEVIISPVVNVGESIYDANVQFLEEVIISPLENVGDSIEDMFVPDINFPEFPDIDIPDPTEYFEQIEQEELERRMAELEADDASQRRRLLYGRNQNIATSPLGISNGGVSTTKTTLGG